MVRFIRSTWPFTPRVVDLGEAVLDAVLLAAHGEHVGHVAGRRAIGVARGEAELDAVTGQNGVDPIGHGRDEGFEKGGGGDARGAVGQLDEGELAGAVDGHEQVELALSGLHLGDVEVEKADGISLELGLGLLVALDLGQARDAVAL
jgi:hypothetical protein